MRAMLDASCELQKSTQGVVMKYVSIAVSAFALATAAAQPSIAQSVAEFYSGKTIQFGVGYPPGGYDAYTRAAARYMGKYIPGNPNVIVINMPGASSFNYVRHLHSRAPKDGTQFGMFDRGLIARSVLDPKTTNVDFGEFTWIGSMNKEVSACFLWNTKNIKSVQDVIDYKGSVILGGTSKNGGGYVYSSLLQRMSPKTVKQVFGYDATSQMLLAAERGEIDGTCTIYGSLKINHPDLFELRKLNVVVQFVETRHPDLPEVQTAYEVARSEDENRVIAFLTSADAIGRPVVGPPGLAADRTEALRKAFMETMKDTEFLAFAKKAQMEIDPMSGEQASKIVADIAATPSHIVELARNILE